MNESGPISFEKHNKILFRIAHAGTEPSEKLRKIQDISKYLVYIPSAIHKRSPDAQTKIVMLVFIMGVSNFCNPEIATYAKDALISFSRNDQLNIDREVIVNALQCIEQDSMIFFDIYLDERKSPLIDTISSAYNDRILKLPPLFRPAVIGRRPVRLDYALELIDTCSLLLGFSIKHNKYRGRSYKNEKFLAFTNQINELLRICIQALENNSHLNHTIVTKNKEKISQLTTLALKRLKTDSYLSNTEMIEAHNLVVTADGRYTNRIKEVETLLDQFHQHAHSISPQ